MLYQPGDLYRLITEERKVLLIGNTVHNMEGFTMSIKYRHAAHCYLAEKDYGNRLGAAMELDFDMSQRYRK